MYYSFVNCDIWIEGRELFIHPKPKDQIRKDQIGRPRTDSIHIVPDRLFNKHLHIFHIR